MSSVDQALTVNEGDAIITTVNLDQVIPDGKTASLKLTLVDDTAIAANGDYSTTLQYSLDDGASFQNLAADGILTLTAKQSSFKIKITTLTDAVYLEGTEKFKLQIQPVSGLKAGSLESIISIVDGTPIPNAIITGAGDTSVIEGNKATVTVNLSGNTLKPASVNLLLEDGYPAIKGLNAVDVVHSALLNADYSTTLEYSVDGGVSFAPANNNSISLPAGISSFQIRSTTLQTKTVRNGVAYKLSVIPVSGITDPNGSGWSVITINDGGISNNASGQWSGVYNWPLEPLHAALLPDGRIMTYGTNGAGIQGAREVTRDGNGNATGLGTLLFDIWDSSKAPDAGHQTLSDNVTTDLFCSAQILLPNAGNKQLFIAGGDQYQPGEKAGDPYYADHQNRNTANYGVNDSNYLDWQPSRPTLTASDTAGKMKVPRWYATVTTLPDGRIFIQGGNGNVKGDNRAAIHPEIHDGNANGQTTYWDNVYTTTGFNNVTNQLNWWYPRNYIAPNGQIFGYDPDGYMYFIDWTKGNTGTTIRSAGNIFNTSNNTGYTAIPVPDNGNTNIGLSSAMYAPGKILQMGGMETVIDSVNKGIRANQSYIIDINTPSNVTVTRSADMSAHRVWGTLTLLADGKVLATGGSEGYNIKCRNTDGTEGTNPGTPGKNCPSGTNVAAYNAEIWNPATGTWKKDTTAAAQVRLYHSMAMLLPDGRVLVGAGGAWGPETNRNVEIYTPPYLIDANNNKIGDANRPQITQAPTQLSPGQNFTIQYNHSSPITRVILMKTGSVTHSFNMEQRIVETTVVGRGSNSVTLQLPTNKFLMPPGFYMVFALDANGIPSKSAQILRMTQ